MVNLGQILKMREACRRRLYKHVTLVLCKKTTAKNCYVVKMRLFLKLGKFVIVGSLNALPNCQFGSSIKIAKSMRRTALQAHYTAFIEKILKETSNIRKILQIWSYGYCATVVALTLQIG